MIAPISLILNRKSASADQRAADCNRPQHQVAKESDEHPSGQVPGPALQDRCPGGELPAREPFSEDELEECAKRECPEQTRPVRCAPNRRGNDIARADPAH